MFITTKPPYEIDETIVTVSNIPGWNIVGLPVDVNDSNYLTIFPNAVNNTLYSYNDGYTQETNLSTVNGYWLRFYDEGENLYERQQAAVNGEAEVTQAGQKVTAKSITYDMAQQLISAEKDENSTDRVHTILVPVENKKDDKGQP